MSYQIRPGMWAKTGQGGGVLYPSHFVSLYDHAEGIDEIHSMDDIVDELRRLFQGELGKDPNGKKILGFVTSMETVAVDFRDLVPPQPMLRPSKDLSAPEEVTGQFAEVAGVQLTLPELAEFIGYVMTNSPLDGSYDPRLQLIDELQDVAQT